MLKYIGEVFKSMAWGVIIPPELHTIILDFLCYSFLRPPRLFFRVSVLWPSTPYSEYILESQLAINLFQTHRHNEWRSIKSFNILQVHSSYKKNRQFINNSCGQGEMPHFARLTYDVALLQSMIIHFRGNNRISFLGMQILRILVNKNIICIIKQEWTKFIIENEDPHHIKEAMHGKALIHYDAKKEVQMINYLRGWQKRGKIPRKGKQLDSRGTIQWKYKEMLLSSFR